MVGAAATVNGSQDEIVLSVHLPRLLIWNWRSSWYRVNKEDLPFSKIEPIAEYFLHIEPANLAWISNWEPRLRQRRAFYNQCAWNPPWSLLSIELGGWQTTAIHSKHSHSWCGYSSCQRLNVSSCPLNFTFIILRPSFLHRRRLTTCSTSRLSTKSAASNSRP